MNNFYAQPLAAIHIELSSYCNAACPMCSRNNRGYGVNPNIRLNHFSLATFKSSIDQSILASLKYMVICGNFGDPLMNPEMIPIFEYIKSVNPKIKLQVHTNGGLGTTATWERLAQLVDFCRFGIDGLEDTNHIYRRNVRWNVLMNNLKTFVSAGGHAQWAFIAFDHNKHQIKAAENFSQELGVKKFLLKTTSRSVRNQGEIINQWPAHSGPDQVDYYIKAYYPEDNIDAEKKFTEVREKYGSYEKYVKETKINCKVMNERSIYIGAEGLVFPCCWLGGDYFVHNKEDNNYLMKELIADLRLREDDFSLKSKSLGQIIQSSFFSEIKNTWDGHKKLFVCGKMCGQEWNPFELQFQNDKSNPQKQSESLS